MKTFVFVLAALAISTYVQAAVLPESLKAVHEEVFPIHLDDVDTNGGIATDSRLPLKRYRRLTCDVFSFESGVVTPNHAACATKCIVMGRKGGSCNGTTCNCRGDKWIG